MAIATATTPRERYPRMPELLIRQAVTADIPAVIDLWEEAREWLRAKGLDQWGSTRLSGERGGTGCAVVGVGRAR
jgi:hypothetical protein